MDELIKRVSKYYGIESYNVSAAHDSSRGDEDLRYIYILETPDGNKLALKINKNLFTTAERVNGWASLTEHYNSLGIYAPRFLKSKTGAYSLCDGGFTVYAEECYEYKTAEETKTKNESFKADLYKSLAVVAANPAPLVPWHTAWCLYDRFDGGDPHDENLMCAVEFTEYIERNLPDHAERARKILNNYTAARAAFESEYRSLPRAVFQGDLNPTNILVSDEGAFRGLCDFNLSGTETILNMLFCECCECLSGGIDRISDVSAQDILDNGAAEKLAIVGELYKFSDGEKRAFTTYYNITYPFRWINFNFYMRHLRESGSKHAADILEWIERQASRKDVAWILP